MAASLLRLRRVVSYLSEVEIVLNLSLRLDPRPLTTAIIATEMPAAIRPYSMAVAPELSFKKRRTCSWIGFQLLPGPKITRRLYRGGHFVQLN